MARGRNQGIWCGPRVTHTHTQSSGHGWGGSVCDCLKAEDAVLGAGGNLGQVPHILNYMIPEGCWDVCQRCAGNLPWEVAQ